jgi:hypothetical protein
MPRPRCAGRNKAVGNQPSLAESCLLTGYLRGTDRRTGPCIGCVERSPDDHSTPPPSDGRTGPVSGGADRDPAPDPGQPVLSRDDPGVRGRVARLLPVPVVPIVAFASLAAIALPTAAASLLVVPGIWVMTRWSLFAPVIVSELLGPLAALKRSNELVRGNFELVCNRADTAGGFPRDRARVRPPTAHGGPHPHLSRPRQRDTSLGASRTAQKRTASYHNLRNRTPRT